MGFYECPEQDEDTQTDNQEAEAAAMREALRQAGMLGDKEAAE